MADINKQQEKYFQNPLFYGKKIKSIVQKRFSDVRILIFGSAARGAHRPGSDIDILIISSAIPQDLFAQAKIKLEVKDKFPDAPFEIHLILSLIHI